MAYASEDDLRGYVSDDAVLPTDPEDMAAMLHAASRDVDALLAPLAVDADEGLKVSGALAAGLSAAQAAALVRACCAAAEWRLVQGDEELVGGADGIASVGGISFTGGPLPRPPGPKVIEELAGLLPVRSGTVAPDEPAADAP